MSAAFEGNQVVAVRYGEVTMPRSECFMECGHVDGPEELITLAYYFWVIFTQERTVIVDTGFDEHVGRRRGRSVIIPVPEAFKLLNLSPDDDVDIVLTHAHYDHIGNVGWFRQAPVYIAREELAYWASPESSPQRALVEKAELRELRSLQNSGRLRLIDKETEITSGVRLLLAPGHTPGQMMVCVETPAERVLLTSDAVHFDAELTLGVPFRHMHDIPATHHSYQRIREMKTTGEIDLIISGHDESTSLLNPPLPGPLREIAVCVGHSYDRPHAQN